MPRWADSGRRPHWAQGGFTLLELVIVIALVILLFLVAFDRLLPLRGQAEAAQVATTIGTLRSALGMEVAERVARFGKVDSAMELEGANPMTLLSQIPSNYVSEAEGGDSPEIESGSWYFDPASRQLRYRVRYPQYLTQDALSRPVELAWRIRLSYRDADGNGRFDPDTDSLRGIALEALDNPDWPTPERDIPQTLDGS